MRTAQQVCALGCACVCVCEFEQSLQMCSSKLNILFTEATLPIFPTVGKTYYEAHSNFNARQYSQPDLSVHGLTCLLISQSLQSFCHPFICLSSFICYYQTKKRYTYFLSWADKTLHITQEQTKAKTHAHQTLQELTSIKPLFLFWSFF